MRTDKNNGGDAIEYTERGFAIYGRITDDRGNEVRVQRSSACGGPYAYVFTQDDRGRGAYFHMGEPHAPSPHLTASQARELAGHGLTGRVVRPPATRSVRLGHCTAYVRGGTVPNSNRRQWLGHSPPLARRPWLRGTSSAVF